ncbi:MAG: CUB domain-containing protein [Flavobacteriales bacterium]
MSSGSFTLNCGTPNNFYDSGGNGGSYLDSQNITTTFTSSVPGQCITVTFSSFSTESGYDYLRIYDGASSGSFQIGQLTGSPATPISFTSSSGSLTFVFTSDGSIVNSGWAATLSCTSACAVAPTPPTNDDPCNAINLSVDADCNFQEFSNLNATASIGVPAPGCANYQGSDVWFSLVVPASGAVVIDSDTGGIFDSGMAVYTGSCSSLALVSCDDDGSMNGAMSLIQATGLVPGSTLYIRMWSYSNGVQGTFGICAHEVPPLTDGDICDFALPFCTGSNYVFPNNTNQQGFGGIDCLGSSPNPVWYYMQIENSGALNIGISQVSDLGNPIDVDFDLWGPFATLADGCTQVNAGTAPSIDCSYSTSATEEANIPNAIAGQYYILLLTNFNGSSGTISFNSLGTSTATTNCAIVCGIEALNYSVSSCDAITNTYELSGTIDLLDPPSTGVLVVSSSCGATTTISQPWPISVPFTLSSLPADGASCDVEVYFSADPSCSYIETFTAPSSCSSVTLNCPEYANTSNSLSEGCGSQTYYLNVENTFCDGTVEFDVLGNYGPSWANEISWDLVSVQTGGVIASGGPGTNGANVNMHIGPLSAQTYGNIFSFNVYDSYGDGFNGVGGYFQVSQNGNILAGPFSGDFGFQAGTIFGVNIAISSASISVNTPNGIIQNTVQNCQDFNVPIF